MAGRAALLYDGGRRGSLRWPRNRTTSFSRYLRRIDERLDRIDDSLQNLIARVGSVEEQLAGLRKDFVRLEARVDQMDDRVKRIERRLDLVEVR